MKLRARIIKALMKKDFRMLAGNKNTFFTASDLILCPLHKGTADRKRDGDVIPPASL